MSTCKVITQETAITLKAENQKKDEQISQLKAVIKDRDETIKTLQKQNADKDKALTKMYKILVATIFELQVSPDAINDCFKVFRRVTKIIERTQKLSVDDKRDIEKKVKVQAKKI